MKKNIILSFILLASVYTTSSVYGQKEDKDSKKSSKTMKSYAPVKGDFAVGINFGTGTFISTGLVGANSYSVSGTPSMSTISTNYNSATNMIGAEGRYYITDGFAVTLSGVATFSSVPSALAIPAVLDPNTNAVIIPGYSAVVEDNRADLSFAVGAQWSFDVKSNKLFPYLGFAIPFNYARRSLYDPTITFGNNGAVITDLGASHINVNAIGLQAVAGVDYYFSDNLYLGASIKPASMYYITNSKVPGPGLPGLQTESLTISSFVQPLLSIGFKF